MISLLISILLSLGSISSEAEYHEAGAQQQSSWYETHIVDEDDMGF